MKRISLLITMSIMAAIAFGGCTIAKISGRGPVPLILNQPQARVEVIEEVRESKQVLFDYTGAFDVSEVLSQHFKKYKADAIINVSVIIQITPGDYFINLFTLGIAQAKTFEVSGQLVRAPKGLSSLSIPGSQILAESKDLKDITAAMLRISQDGAGHMIARVDKEDGVSYRLIHFGPEINAE